MITPPSLDVRGYLIDTNMDAADISTSDEFEIIGRLALAGLLGAFIGLERELRGYPAGIRTLALVTVGAALFTDASKLFDGDNGRVAAQIVTGIGFLGAGVIFREGYTVRGITTAATIWSAAAIGMAIGLELYWVAVLGALLVFALLEARPLTRRFERVIAPKERGLRETLADLVEGGGVDDPEAEPRGDDD
jgi:putative Mg2+ transporter-C (MgtC) family protein